MSLYHLTIEERENIYIMKHDDLSINIIADKIRRSSSTILRELKRNNPIYSPSKAQIRYQNCKTNCGRRVNAKPLKIIKHLFLGFQWSPNRQFLPDCI